MSKKSILDKMKKIISELKCAGDNEESDWLKDIESELKIVEKQEDLSLELGRKLSDLSQKSIATRGYIDTQGDLDMATWANLLDSLATDLNETYSVN